MVVNKFEAFVRAVGGLSSHSQSLWQTLPVLSLTRWLLAMADPHCMSPTLHFHLTSPLFLLCHLNFLFFLFPPSGFKAVLSNSLNVNDKDLWSQSFTHFQRLVPVYDTEKGYLLTSLFVSYFSFSFSYECIWSTVGRPLAFPDSGFPQRWFLRRNYSVVTSGGQFVTFRRIKCIQELQLEKNFWIRKSSSYISLKKPRIHTFFLEE